MARTRAFLQTLHRLPKQAAMVLVLSLRPSTGPVALLNSALMVNSLSLCIQAEVKRADSVGVTTRPSLNPWIPYGLPWLSQLRLATRSGMGVNLYFWRLTTRNFNLLSRVLAVSIQGSRSLQHATSTWLPILRLHTRKVENRSLTYAKIKLFPELG